MSLLDNTADLAPAWARYNEILVERGEGACLYDVNGRHYLDFTCGIGVTNTGHCHPRVVEAIREQAGLLLHGQANIVYHKPMLQLVESLRAVLPASLDTFFFSNSGAEAIEGAVKLARQVSGRSSIIAFEGGFHGRTAGAMALTSSKGKYRAGHAPLPAGVYTAPYAHCYGCAVAAAAGRDTSAISRAAPLAECCGEPLRRLEHMLHTQIAPEDVAAMVVEPVIGEGGYIVPPASFLQGLRRICDQHGILLIVDEVQTGFGRTGSFFAFEQFGITPDILVIAKGLASGLPLSGIIARREIMGRWRPGSHGGTYGGNAVACAAAVATIGDLPRAGKGAPGSPARRPPPPRSPTLRPRAPPHPLAPKLCPLVPELLDSDARSGIDKDISTQSDRQRRQGARCTRRSVSRRSSPVPASTAGSRCADSPTSSTSPRRPCAAT